MKTGKKLLVDPKQTVPGLPPPGVSAGKWVLTLCVPARIVGVYQRWAPWPQMRSKFRLLTHVCLHACVRGANLLRTCGQGAQR